MPLAAWNAGETMAARTVGREWVGPQHRIQVTFQVPIAFAFSWCTDFSSEDGKLAGESFRRKVVQRTPRRVVFEDIEESRDGWIWSREVVTLRPPNRWHMDGIGNRRDVTADYLLTSLPTGGTLLDLRWRRRPNVPGAGKLTKAQREASALRSWKRFASAMERDYRQRQRKAR